MTLFFLQFHSKNFWEIFWDLVRDSKKYWGIWVFLKFLTSKTLYHHCLTELGIYLLNSALCWIWYKKLKISILLSEWNYKYIVLSLSDRTRPLSTELDFYKKPWSYNKYFLIHDFGIFFIRIWCCPRKFYDSNFLIV